MSIARLTRSLGTTFAAFIAVIALAASTVAITAPANAAPSAPQERARNYYGAISLSVDGAIGFAFDKSSRAKAFNVAVKHCKNKSDYRGRCVKVGWVRNGCGAVAVKYNSDGFVKKYKYGYAATKNGAKRNARKNFGGKIRGWVCTTR